jgi:hypothetical protein
MTLIEVLAVVCIIALAASVTMVGLIGASDEARLWAALDECRRLDARARLLACMEGPMLIVAENDPEGLNVARIGAEGQPLMRAAAPAGWSWHLRDPSGIERAAVSIDARGRSDDYVIQLLRPAAADARAVERRLRVAGLTGWIQEADEP